MRSLLLIGFLALPLVACENEASNDQEIVDTTLNDAGPNAAQPAQLADDETSPAISTTNSGSQVAKRSTTSPDYNDFGVNDVNELQVEANREASAATPRGDVRALFSSDDYPASAQAAGAEGISQAMLTIGADGRVVACNITRSTGNGALDSTTCNVLRRRARFTPARDSNGNPVTATITTPPIVWRLSE